MDVQLVDNEDALKSMLTRLKALPKNPPSIYIDCEGHKLGRSGTLDLLQIYASPLRKIFMVDIYILQHKAFTTPSDGCTLKSLLESDGVGKVIFDVRNDSDAFFSHFQISPRGVVDLQLLEYFQPGRAGIQLLSLKACIERDGGLSHEHVGSWSLSKQAGLNFLKQDHNTQSYPSRQRPLPEVLLRYCAVDVQYLPPLYSSYGIRLSKQAWKNVRRESERRVQQSQQPRYDPQGKNKWKDPTRFAVKTKAKPMQLPAVSNRESRVQQENTGGGSVEKQQASTNRDIQAVEKQQASTNRDIQAVEKPLSPGSSVHMNSLAGEMETLCVYDAAVGSTASQDYASPNFFGAQAAPPNSLRTPIPLRHQPVTFVREGSSRRHRKKQISGSKRCDRSDEFLYENLDWTLCDKDCAWCGHCNGSVEL